MPKYQVISSQIVYNAVTIEAESQEQAEQLAFEGDYQWRFYDCADWQIEKAEEVDYAEV